MSLFQNAVKRLLGTLLTLTAIACGKSDLVLPGPSAPNNAGSPAAISIFGGDHQSAAPGAPLPAPIVVKVVDAQGDPVASQSVAFTPMSGGPGAQVNPQTATTDANGLARANWVLGADGATQEVVAQVVGDEQLQVRFSATAQPGTPSPSTLEIRTQPSSSANLGTQFGRQPVVQLLGSDGKDLKQGGVPVTAAVVSGAGVLAGTTTQLTDSKGQAEFTDLRIEGGTGLHVLIFAAAGYTSVTSDPIDIQQPVVGNQPPTAVGDEYTTLEGGDHVLSVSSAGGVLQNDRDPEGGSLTASDASDPPNGRVTLNPDGSFSYTPASGFFGDDRFTYRAKDPSGSSSTATVTVHVLPVNDSPRFSIKVDNVKVRPGQTPHTVNRFAVGVTPGADNETDQVLTFEVIGNSNPGLFASGPTVTRDGQGDTAALTFTPAGDQTGSAEVTIRLRDNGGTANGGADTSRSQTFRIRVE
jgi:Big-like domain-containing protein